jgi:cytochrome c oxidase subunit 4
MRTEPGAHAQTPPAAPVEHAHPGSREYVTIAIILAIITAAEVIVYYQESIRSVLVPILLILSISKFALVALFFMHLKFDSRLFSVLFSGPLALMIAVLIALLSIFHRVLLGI